ncbi:MAG: hypothetical protein GYB31_07165 [Bacteroidetes bacterium]|nr:hypothetical protein [Bacteroidota bacterium]
MKKFKGAILLLFFLQLFLISPAKSQDVILSATDWNNNAVYGTVGYLILYGVVNGSYERNIYRSESGFFRAAAIRAAYGGYATWGEEGRDHSLSLIGLTGSGNNHFEAGLGLHARFDRLGYKIGVSNAEYFGEPKPGFNDYTMWWPHATAGYRFQKPDGWFVFRTGVGFPEAVYLSFGVAF